MECGLLNNSYKLLIHINYSYKLLISYKLLTIVYKFVYKISNYLQLINIDINLSNKNYFRVLLKNILFFFINLWKWSKEKFRNDIVICHVEYREITD